MDCRVTQRRRPSDCRATDASLLLITASAFERPLKDAPFHCHCTITRATGDGHGSDSLDLHSTITTFTQVSSLDRNHAVPPHSPLKRLNPYLDDNHVMRVGDRLKHAGLPLDERHPMIVLSESWMARLLVDICHCRTMHEGVQLTLGLLRHRFWIPQDRATMKKFIHQCVTYTRWRAAAPQLVTGNLPLECVTLARPF